MSVASEESPVSVSNDLINVSGPIEGVGVLLHPPLVAIYDEQNDFVKAVDARPIANDLAGQIRKGSIITLPSIRDEHGHLVWDFRIEDGDPGQVEVRRNEE